MFRILWVFTKSLRRIASALEEIRDLYKLELSTRGIMPLSPGVKDEVEVVYGYQASAEDEG